MSVVGDSVLGMAQRFDDDAPRAEDDSPGEVIEVGADVPVLNLATPPAGISVIDLGALATTAWERALAELIGQELLQPVGGRLARRSVDPQLYTLLTRMDFETADDDALVEAAAAAERLESAAHALKLQAAAALSHREAMNPAALAHSDHTRRDVAGDELAVRLRITTRAGADLVRRGRALEGVLLATGQALAAGVIDAARARVIIDGLDHVPPEVAATVEDQVLGRAPQRTVAQLRADVAKALIAVDAEAAADRSRYRATQRRISRPRAHPDGIASMRIEGPAADVLALDVALQAAARAAKAAGDERTIDQLRFDALAGVAHHALATGHLTTAPRTSQASVQEPTSTGDIDLPLATAHGHRPSILITLPLDQLLPATTGGCPPGTPPRPTAAGSTPAAGTAPLAGATAGAPPGSPATDDATWPPPLPGQRLHPDHVPLLDGYGPIDPATARALAAGGTWRRVVTDPLTGAVLDVGHTRYRPTQAMADHILARDRTCARPGCTHRATECQLDHTQEWNHHRPQRGGRTAVTNLAPLCGRDHQVKTHGDFHLTQTGPGTFEWATPTGHRYRRERDGSTTALTHPDHTTLYQPTENRAPFDAQSAPDGQPPF